VLFYTIFLPLILLVWYGKGITPPDDPNYTIYGSRNDAGQQQQPSSGGGQRNNAVNMTPTISPNAASHPTVSGVSSSAKMSHGAGRFSNPSGKRPQSTHQRGYIPERAQVDGKIAMLRKNVDEQPFDVKSLVELANNLRNRNTIYAEGGIDDKEAIWCYDRAISLLKDTKKQAAQTGAKDQVALVDTFLCMTTYYLGLVWSGSDMYEDAIKVFAEAQNYKCEPDEYINILMKRGYAYMIMGDYENAAKDYFEMYKLDKDRFLQEGLGTVVRIAESNADVIPGGWNWIVNVVEKDLQRVAHELDSAYEASLRELAAKKLQKMHLALWTYHDKITKDRDSAWKHLEQSQYFKQIYTMSLPETETEHYRGLKEIFNVDFIQKIKGAGNMSKMPIFIVGFPRSGTTLLERVLDAHPQVAGLGENSIMNGKVGSIRSQLQDSYGHGWSYVHQVITTIGNEVVTLMEKRWDNIVDSRLRDGEDSNEVKPTRIIDKLNTNHRNVGFIHMLFPNALIIHAARNPMDSVFSAYKHDFNVEYPMPDGSTKNFDNMCRMNTAVEVYQAYRDVMDHWESVMPGRIMHVRYEELVHDLEGVAKAVIAAAGLTWHDEILNFHLRKQAVNTWSSTQVRKGINTKGIDAWKKYEAQLEPMVKMLGDYMNYDLTTSHYTPSKGNF